MYIPVASGSQHKLTVLAIQDMALDGVSILLTNDGLACQCDIDGWTG